jgi:hypothetical protein
MAELRPRRAAPSGRTRGRQGGEGQGRRRRRGLPWDRVERTDVATAVSGDKNDGERRKKHCGEEDEQGAIPRLTGRPLMQRRRLPNCLPHRPGERFAHVLAAGPRRAGPPRFRPKTRRGKRGESRSRGGNCGWAAREGRAGPPPRLG